MTQRAKRMRKALEAFGWDCDDSFTYEWRTCDECGTPARDHLHKHCSNCGAKLKKATVNKARSSVSQIEAAMKYALGETKKLPE